LPNKQTINMPFRDAKFTPTRASVIVTGCPYPEAVANTLRRALVEGRIPVLRLKSTILVNTARRVKDEVVAARLATMWLAVTPASMPDWASRTLTLHVRNDTDEVRRVGTEDFGDDKAWFQWQYDIEDLQPGDELHLTATPVLWTHKTVIRTGLAMVPDPELQKEKALEYEDNKEFFEREMAQRLWSRAAPEAMFWFENPPEWPVSPAGLWAELLTRLADLFAEFFRVSRPAGTDEQHTYEVVSAAENETVGVLVTRVLQSILVGKLVVFDKTLNSSPDFRIQFYAGPELDPDDIWDAATEQVAAIWRPGSAAEPRRAGS
jgi:hypothetical protein